MKEFSKAKLICFTGIDGSGKTTLAKFLVEELRRRGIRVRYIYGRYQPIISKPAVILGKLLLARGIDIKEYKDYSNNKRLVAQKHPYSLVLYQNFLMLDYYIQLLIKIIIPIKFGIAIVCDRYVYDTIINDMPRAQNNFDDIKRMTEICFKIAPKPDISFLIDVPENLAFARKNDTPSIDYLKERRGFYISFGKLYDMTVLDGTNDLKKIEDEVKESVFK